MGKGAVAGRSLMIFLTHLRSAIFIHFRLLNNLQPCKLLTVLFFQGVGDVCYQLLVGRNRDVLQGVGTLLGLADAGGQAVGGGFHHGKPDGQLL